MSPGVRCLLPLLALLSGCGLTGEGAFPSLQPRAGEVPREISAPDAGMPAALSGEERTALVADLAREEEALAQVSRDVLAAEAALAPALKAALQSPIGSEPWSIAQLHLSRFDQARGALGTISSRTGSMQIKVDSLPATDADRLRVLALVRDIEALQKTSGATAAAANKALARG